MQIYVGQQAEARGMDERTHHGIFVDTMLTVWRHRHKSKGIYKCVSFVKQCFQLTYLHFRTLKPKEKVQGKCMQTHPIKMTFILRPLQILMENWFCFFAEFAIFIFTVAIQVVVLFYYHHSFIDQRKCRHLPIHKTVEKEEQIVTNWAQTALLFFFFTFPA